MKLHLLCKPLPFLHHLVSILASRYNLRKKTSNFPYFPQLLWDLSFIPSCTDGDKIPLKNSQHILMMCMLFMLIRQTKKCVSRAIESTGCIHNFHFTKAFWFTLLIWLCYFFLPNMRRINSVALPQCMFMYCLCLLQIDVGSLLLMLNPSVKPEMSKLV